MSGHRLQDREIAEGADEHVVNRAADRVPARRDGFRQQAAGPWATSTTACAANASARTVSACRGSRTSVEAGDDEEADGERDVEADALLRVRGRPRSRCRRRRSAPAAAPRTAPAAARPRADRATTAESSRCGSRARRSRPPARIAATATVRRPSVTIAEYSCSQLRVPAYARATSRKFERIDPVQRRVERRDDAVERRPSGARSQRLRSSGAS